MIFEVREVLARVDLLDRRRRSTCDLPEVDVREHRPGDLQCGGIARDVVRDRRRRTAPTESARNRLQAANWSGVNGASLAPKSTVPVRDRLDAAARADRVVVEVHTRGRLVRLATHVGHERRHERAAGSLERAVRRFAWRRPGSPRPRRAATAAASATDRSQCPTNVPFFGSSSPPDSDCGASFTAAGRCVGKGAVPFW